MKRADIKNNKENKLANYVLLHQKESAIRGFSSVIMGELLFVCN